MTRGFCTGHPARSPVSGLADAYAASSLRDSAGSCMAVGLMQPPNLGSGRSLPVTCSEAEIDKEFITHFPEIPQKVSQVLFLTKSFPSKSSL